MKEINTYGLTMNGLEEAAAETRNIRPNSGHYVQISYDRDSGDVMSDYHVDENSRVRYNSDRIVTVGFFADTVSAQCVADHIRETLDMLEEVESDA